MRWKLNSDWTNLLNYGSYKIVTKYYSVIFGSNFVDAKLGWIVINCRFIICKGSADQWRLFERGIKRGISMSANPLSAQPHRAGLPHQSPNWHPTTPSNPPLSHVLWLCFPNFLLRVLLPLLFSSQGTDRLEAIFLDQFLLFVDFRATRHGHNCESGPTPRIARCQFVPTKLMIYYRPIKMYLVRFRCLPSLRYFEIS